MTYAIFSTGGQQFRAEPGVTIKVPLLDAKPGDEVSFDQILLASDGKHVQTGAPKVKGAKVTAEAVRRAKRKIRIFLPLPCRTTSAVTFAPFTLGAPVWTCLPSHGLS